MLTLSPLTTMQPFPYQLLAKLEMYPDFSDSITFIIVGFTLVLIVLALIYLVCEIIGATFKLSVKPAAAPAAAVAVDTPGTPPKAPEKSPEDNDPRLVAVIAAAVHTVIRQPHRVVAIRALRHDEWAREGRRQIFDSHKLR